MSLDFLIGEKEREYYALVSKLESNDNPNAKNPRSTASGRFQFIKSTWEGLGYRWADVFNDALQWEAIEKFTASNAEILRRSGCYLNFATLYGAHFLGVSGFLRVMRAAPSDRITTVTSAGQRTANPSILGTQIDGRPRTVKDFTDWLESKTGHKYNVQYGHIAPAPVPPPRPVDDVSKPVERAKGGAVGAVIAVVIFIIGKILGAV